MPKPITLDPDTLNSAAGLTLSKTDIQDIAHAAAWYRYWEHRENADGDIPTVNGMRRRLKKIADIARKLETELRRDDPDGYAAADLSGGLYAVDRIADIAQRAEYWREQARGDSGRLETESRKTLVAVCKRCWSQAGGEGDGAYINTWEDREEYGPLIMMILEVIRQSGIPKPPNPKTIQRDIRSVKTQEAEITFITAPPKE